MKKLNMFHVYTMKMHISATVTSRHMHSSLLGHRQQLNVCVPNISRLLSQPCHVIDDTMINNICLSCA